MEKQEDFVQCAPIKRGDYVRLRDGWNAPTGVVWEIHPRNAASVEVYYPVNGKTEKPTEYEPKELVVVPTHEVAEYLVKFKGTMER
jgi:hypothetical protein